MTNVFIKRCCCWSLRLSPTRLPACQGTLCSTRFGSLAALCSASSTANTAEVIVKSHIWYPSSATRQPLLDKIFPHLHLLQIDSFTFTSTSILVTSSPRYNQHISSNSSPTSMMTSVHFLALSFLILLTHVSTTSAQFDSWSSLPQCGVRLQLDVPWFPLTMATERLHHQWHVIS